MEKQALKSAKIHALFLQLREARTIIKMLISWRIAQLNHTIQKGKEFTYKNISAHNYGSWTHVTFPEAVTAYKGNQNEMEITSLITEIPSKRTSFSVILIGFISDFFTIIAFLIVSGWFWLLSSVRKGLKLIRKRLCVAKNGKQEHLETKIY